MGLVYCLINKINGKAYIGQTLRKLNFRMAEHLYCANKGKNIPISNAIRKYGINNFLVEVLDVSDNIDTLNKKEIYWIGEKRTLAPDGYNMASGGLNGKPHPETIRKIVESRKGWHPSEEHKRRISLKLTGKKRPEFGKLISKIQKGRKLSQETKNRISKSNKETFVKGRVPWNKKTAN